MSVKVINGGTCKCGLQVQIESNTSKSVVKESLTTATLTTALNLIWLDTTKGQS